MKGRTGRALHAMVGPQRLRTIGHGDGLERRRTRMARSERAVAGWMPVLRQNHMIETLGEPVDDRHDRVALADSQGAIRAEIVLHVDDQQQIVGLNLHASSSMLMRPSLAECRYRRSSKLRQRRPRSGPDPERRALLS